MDVGGGYSGFVTEHLCLGGAALPSMRGDEYWVATLSDRDQASGGQTCDGGGTSQYSTVTLNYGGRAGNTCGKHPDINGISAIDVVAGEVTALRVDCSSGECATCRHSWAEYGGQCFDDGGSGADLKFVFGAMDTSICAT
jgi:hypothetical protein